MKSIFKNFIIFFLIFVFIAGIFSFYDSQKNGSQEISLAKLVQEINNEAVAKIEVAGNQLTITLKNNEKKTSQKEINESLSELLKNYGVAPEKIAALDISISDEPNSGFFLTTILPIILPIII